MNGHGFTSALAPELGAYLAFKVQMGCYGTSRIWYLRQFDAYCTAHHRAVFDRDTVEGWVIEQLTRSGRYRPWMSYIRDVGRWLQAHGRSDAHVLSNRWKAPFVPAHPYLLAKAEIEAFFAAAATLDAQSPWRWQAVAFFTLMHCCGLRTGETRLLRAEHVHLPDHDLDLVSSKGNRSRRLPLTDQVVEVLAGCDQKSRDRFGSRPQLLLQLAAQGVAEAVMLERTLVTTPTKRSEDVLGVVLDPPLYPRPQFAGHGEGLLLTDARGGSHNAMPEASSTNMPTSTGSSAIRTSSSLAARPSA